MAWEKNNQSRRTIDRAGEILKAGRESINRKEYLDAYNVMDVWRSSHAFPLNTIQVSLRRRSRSIDPSSTVVQRMKRAPSVIQKLRRNPKMKLSRMQDLGGARSIIGSVDSVYKLRVAYTDSRDRHELATEKDYIENPRDSGYRGYHIIYKYKSDRNNEYNDHRIEIQLRTKIQHYWATSVEIAGIFLNKNIKSSIGPEEWLDFFRYTSSAFSFMENTQPLHNNLNEIEVRKKVSNLNSKFDFLKKLNGFSIGSKAVRRVRNKGYSHFLLILDMKKSQLSFKIFSSLKKATEEYADVERDIVENELVDAVLVSAESFDSVTTAYPNYFADTTEFIHNVDRFLR